MVSMIFRRRHMSRPGHWNGAVSLKEQSVWLYDVNLWRNPRCQNKRHVHHVLIVSLVQYGLLAGERKGMIFCFSSSLKSNTDLSIRRCSCISTKWYWERPLA